MAMTERKARSAGPEERAHHAGDDGPAPSGSDWRNRRRMSARRKQGAVLWLLRGEDLELLSRELGVTAAELTVWGDAFLVAGEAALKTRPADGHDAEIGRLKAKVGELTMAKRTPRRQDRPPGDAPPFGTAEVEAMSRQVSPSTNRLYGVAMVSRLCRTPALPSTAI